MKKVPTDRNTIGEIVCRGNTVMTGYLKDVKATGEAFKGGWFHTGDLAVKHPDGYIEIKDRMKDILISGGENISTLEMEKVLYSHPAVVEAAVVARPDDHWGQTPCTFVKLKEGFEEINSHEIIKFCGDHLPHYMVPRTVIFEDLPRTSTGKQGFDIVIEEKKPEEVEDRDWNIINRLACGIILSCLSREKKYAFKNKTSPRKLWKVLEDKFLKKSGQNKLLMKKRLFQFDYQQGTIMNEHIMFNKLVADLLNLDVKFKDEDLALMLLSSLRNEFEHLETMLLHGKENISLDVICSAFYSYELTKQDKMKTK
ncbi:Acetate/butyrate--CoA ligase AAE7, peroxisomal [Capsicum chinense]|nr:Acetate/butyrate--CoA ligase AAE7, peroxisomal [Capsicum chinense]